MVAETLAAAAALDWPRPYTVYVLDDGGSTELEAEALGRGFIYRSRRRAGVSMAGAKAGNLNFGLAQSTGDFILVLDADQVAQPKILRVLAGYMRFPDVAFIQSRQLYRVPVGDPFFSLDQVFYQAVQLGYDNRDSAISCVSLGTSASTTI